MSAPGGSPKQGRTMPTATPGPAAAHWKNHLQVPPMYAVRQPQLAHMASSTPSSSSEIMASLTNQGPPPLSHTRIPPSWHTPTTNTNEFAAHSPGGNAQKNAAAIFSLQQMMLAANHNNLATYRRDSPTASVDLSFATNLSKNGPTNDKKDERSSPISLSVRDAKQINSLAESKLKNKASPKKVRVDSILDRLNPSPPTLIIPPQLPGNPTSLSPGRPGSVIVTPQDLSAIPYNSNLLKSINDRNALANIYHRDTSMLLSRPPQIVTTLSSNSGVLINSPLAVSQLTHSVNSMTSKKKVIDNYLEFPHSTQKNDASMPHHHPLPPHSHHHHHEVAQNKSLNLVQISNDHLKERQDLNSTQLLSNEMNHSTTDFNSSLHITNNSAHAQNKLIQTSNNDSTHQSKIMNSTNIISNALNSTHASQNSTHTSHNSTHTSQNSTYTSQNSTYAPHNSTHVSHITNELNSMHVSNELSTTHEPKERHTPNEELLISAHATNELNSNNTVVITAVSNDSTRDELDSGDCSTRNELANNNEITTVTSQSVSPALSACHEDSSLDSNKSRRKRKPSKTIRVPSRDNEKKIDLGNEKSSSSSDDNKSNFENSNIISSSLASSTVTSTTTIINGNSTEGSTSAKSTTGSLRMTRRAAKRKVDDVNSPSVSTTTNMSSPKASPQCNKSETETIEDIAAMIASTSPTLKESTGTINSCSNSADAPIDLVNVLGSPNEKKYEEVENKLEQMFAGLETTNPKSTIEGKTTTQGKLKTKGARKAPVDCRVEPIVIRQNRMLQSPKKGAEVKSNNLSDDDGGGVKVEKIESKPKIRLASDTDKTVKEVEIVNSIVAAAASSSSYDSSGSTLTTIRSSSLRGPFIKIRGPNHTQVINNFSISNSTSGGTNIGGSTSVQDNDELNKSRKYHDESREFRQQLRGKGLHTSTLSLRYDVHTKDTTWVCVFCKRGPHTDLEKPEFLPNIAEASDDEQLLVKLNSDILKLTYSSGDLFGPYYITSNCDEYKNSLDDINEYRFKKLQKTKQEGSLSPADFYAAAHPTKYSTKYQSKRSKRGRFTSPSAPVLNSFTDGDVTQVTLDGMLKIDESKYEIWAHEDCIVWAPGVFLSGLRLVGLEGAVWSCCTLLCEYCSRGGATVFCLTRSCALVAHVPCAFQNSWTLDNDTFKAYCSQHKPNCIL